MKIFVHTSYQSPITIESLTNNLKNRLNIPEGAQINLSKGDNSELTKVTSSDDIVIYDTDYPNSLPMIGDILKVNDLLNESNIYFGGLKATNKIYNITDWKLFIFKNILSINKLEDIIKLVPKVIVEFLISKKYLTNLKGILSKN